MSLNSVSGSIIRLTARHLPPSARRPCHRFASPHRPSYTKANHPSALPVHRFLRAVHTLRPTSRPLPTGFDPVTICAGTTLILATLVSYSYLQSLILETKEEAPSTSQESYIPGTPFTGPQIIDGRWVMTPTPLLEGRVGNLTPEQEVKLRELWAAVLKIFNVPDISAQSSAETVAVANGAAAINNAANTPDTADKKTKKSRFGFGRSKKDEKEDHADPGSFGTGDADDKYGESAEFKAAIAAYKPEDLRSFFWSMLKQDDPDALMLRFLRARKWDVQKALVMLFSTIKWRATEYHVDDEIMRLGEMGNVLKSRDPSGTDESRKDGADFVKQIEQGKTFLHGIDAEGRPITYVRARLHKPGLLTQHAQEQIVIYCIETCRLTLAPPVDTATIMFDLTDFSITNMDYTMAKFVIKCFEAHYPESLGLCLIHGAPWLFQGVWKIVKGWLDPVVAAKVHFTNDVNELKKYIAPEHIIKELGGAEDWVYEDAVKRAPGPTDEDIVKLRDTESRNRIQSERDELVKEYEARVLEWVKDGGVHDSPARKELVEGLRRNYWQLDPYVRAKSPYDRMGVLSEGGNIDFYPAEKK